MNKRSHKIPFILAAILIIGGMYFLMDGISMRKETNDKIENCIEKTTAKVVGPEKQDRTSGKFPRKMYQAGLEIPDRDYILMSPWSNKKFTLNSTIEIFYDPTSPDTLYIPSNPHFSASEARRDIIEGIIGILLGIYVIFDEIKLMKKEGIL